MNVGSFNTNDKNQFDQVKKLLFMPFFGNKYSCVRIKRWTNIMSHKKGDDEWVSK
jgi:hypothetical protein